MPLVYDPKYILRLEDLPKIVESDGVVYPVYMTVRDCARLFGATPEQVKSWIIKSGIPTISFSGLRYYIPVGEFNDWIVANSRPRGSAEPDGDDEIDGES